VKKTEKKSKTETAIKRLMVANRGEIARRVFASAKNLGIETLAVYSEADSEMSFVKEADRSVMIGPGPAAESYLSIKKILEVAKSEKVDAIHPGYGFLSERAEFAKAVIDAGIQWLGPSPRVIELMGNKVAAKKAAESAGVPTLPWAILAEGWTAATLKASAKKVGFPLLLKAAAGGGGRGMRLVHGEGELLEKAESAAREALGSFGSGEIFLERYLAASKHIEVQVLGDRFGKVIALGERDCSSQRRHQKVIEEAPAPNLLQKTREALCKAAVDLAASVNYESAGTCEFLVDESGNIYFLEMNTRLQVEHPVTELVWSVDLVAAQIQIAQGKTLREIIPHVDNLSARGHAIELRVYAEDPAKGFMPQPGELGEVRWPSGPFVRVDQGFESGSTVSIFYDAMLGKVIAWGMIREQARTRVLRAICETEIEKVRWNGDYLRDILEHEDFIDGNVTTQFLGEKFANWKPSPRTKSDQKKVTTARSNPNADAAQSPWIVYGDATVAATKRYSKAGVGVAATVGVVGGPLCSEYPGKVLKVNVKAGDLVAEGQALIVCESMKMEFTYAAPAKAKVANVNVKTGMVIAAGAVLIEWETT